MQCISMGDPAYHSGSSGNAKVTTVANGKTGYKRNLVASDPKEFQQSAYRNLDSLSHGRNRSAAVGHVAIFMLQIAALETVRRVSRSKCPFVWHGLQALQLLCYPPFKWIQTWSPFKGLFKGVQMLSRPLLVLSIATAFTDQPDFNNETSDGINDSTAHSETQSESPSTHSSPDTRGNDGAPQIQASENWLMQLHKELENQGITLPERIDEDELHRFYTAANGDFSCMLLSVKKTIQWRENYRILSEQELDMWSNTVFWHGVDVEQRPCLILRLGLACNSLPSHERPRFAQAIISQVEHGVLHLVDKDNPQITVLVDCDGISPLRIPMQMMRTCCSHLQENFPNRLGYLLVIRIPPVVRVIAQTFIQVLKPVTRKKLRIEGNMYHRVLSDYLQSLPSYLGGNCTCKICSDIGICVRRRLQSTKEVGRIEPNEDVSDGSPPYLTGDDDIHVSDNWDHLLRASAIGILMLLVLMALIAGFYDPESRPF